MREHPFRSEYIEAVEKQLNWLRWGQSQPGQAEFRRLGMHTIAQTYTEILETAETFYMNGPFCAMVDHARRTVPGELEFDARWLQAKRGWIWCATPFLVPRSEMQASDDPDLYIRAIGWREIPEGEWLVPAGAPKYRAPAGCVQFCAYVDSSTFPGGSDRGGPWTTWAYFVLKTGDRMDFRIHEFETKGRVENPGGAYVPASERIPHPLHEMRWIYTALHLMSQRLALTVQAKPDRATRRRVERLGAVVPPFLRVVTLRRMEQARVRAQGDADREPVDWQWQWDVRGHWRKQPTNDGIKDVYIEKYRKGPADKPLKPDSLKIFAARR